MARPSRFSPEVRERAVRMVFEHAQEHASQWAAITSIAEKIGCAAETLRSWVRQAERDAGQRYTAYQPFVGCISNPRRCAGLFEKPARFASS